MKDKQYNLCSKWCEVCDYTFENEDDLQQHLLTRSHIKRNSRNNSVYISGIPNSPEVLDELLQFLSQIGEVVKHKTFEKKGQSFSTTFVEFKNCLLKWNMISVVETLHRKYLNSIFYSDTVKVILSKGLHINNINLRIRKAEMTYEEKWAQTISYEAIKPVFDNGTFEEQLLNFIQEISLTEANVKMNYEPVCQDLEKLFKPIFPKCRVFKFGSSVTGIGFKKCDLDIYLDTGIPVVKADKKTGIGPHILSADILFPIVEETIRKNYDKFSRCIAIPTARVPIVKCFYNPTKVLCDISFKSKLGVYNSRLLKFYLTIDSRFKLTMIILKYWYYNCELRSYIGITKYALTVMFIFCLQQLGLVPTANTLKEQCEAPLLINGWQANFGQNLNDFQMNEDYKNKSIPELLLSFFEFYKNYDFQTNVACLSDGQSYNKKLFHDIESLPNSMKTYKEYLNASSDPEIFNIHRAMCIQDPIELTWNVTKIVSANCLDKFQLFCFISANIITTSFENNCKSLLNDLFGFPNKSVINHVPAVQEIKTFSIDPCNIYSKPKKLEDFSFGNDWINLAFKLIHQYLEKVLNLEVTSNDNSNHLNEKMDNQILVLNCKGSHCLWKNRKSVKNLEKSEDPIQNEINISKLLLSQTHLQSDGEIVINFECRLEEKKEPNTHILVTLSNIEGTKRIFPEIANDMMYKMLSVIRKSVKFALRDKSLT